MGVNWEVSNYLEWEWEIRGNLIFNLYINFLFPFVFTLLSFIIKIEVHVFPMTCGSSYNGFFVLELIYMFIFIGNLLYGIRGIVSICNTDISLRFMISYWASIGLLLILQLLNCLFTHCGSAIFPHT